MMSTDIRECACGTVMARIKGFHICENCDICQPQERQVDASGKAKGRRITTADRRYNLAWEARKRQIYGTK